MRPIQITDFGLSKPEQYFRTRQSGAAGGLPIRYMPPEAIQRNRWGEPSDVWAFGVLMWEVATMGAIPYQSHGVFKDDEQVQVGVCSGALRLPRPPGCNDCIYDIMTRCWEQQAAARPTFRELHTLLREAIFVLGATDTAGGTATAVRQSRRAHRF